MGQEKFDTLLNAMPTIAESINSFNSDEVQLAAFQALVAALEIDVDAATSASKVESNTTSHPASTASAPTSENASNGSSATRPRRAKKSAAKKSYSPVKDLNFSPPDHPSLDQFVAEKDPKSQYEKNLVACYYLAEFMGIEEITVGHVIAVYRACGWDSPKDPDNSLQSTASSKHWLDTANMGAIKVVWAGQNYLEKMSSDSK